MTDYTELRRLAADAVRYEAENAWLHPDYRNDFIAAASPAAIIELVDTIDAFAAAQMKAGDNAATLHAEIEEQAWAQALLAGHNAVLEAERDEARAAVKMLAEALVRIVKGENRLPGASMVEHEPMDAARAALAAPVVKKIIEGGE